MGLAAIKTNQLIAGEIAQSGGVENYLKTQQNKGLLRFLTCGNVDDGKSTLIGRLLHDTRQIYEDQLSTLQNESKKIGTQGEKLDLALLVDGLAAEREQGITIDVAYRYFSTAKRKFIIADTPGHAQYTRNMATGASTSTLSILLIDARKGVQEQTRRHSFISILLGIRHLVVAINKMDLLDYQQEIFESIQQDYLHFAQQLPRDLTIEFVPISALEGDNVVSPSLNMPWYTGKTLLALLEDAPVKFKLGAKSQRLRFPVQYVNRPDLDFRGYSGTVSSGSLYQGQQIKVLPSGQRSTIKRIVTFDGDLAQAQVGQAITLLLADEIDISRGDIIVDANDTTANVSNHALVDIVWMSEQPLVQGQTLDIKVAGKKSRAKIENIHYQVDVDKLTQQVTESLALNAIGHVEVLFEEPLVLDNYQLNAQTGGLIFIDRLSNVTVGAGLIREIRDNVQPTTSQYDAFEIELNQLIRRHFPHWGARDLLGGK
ncbi:sulfate adenylyltransferase subunit CysN [Proteus mirabilis]|uniref:sulfate adenylyltransferase subunit CysN n=1 Tax=Proteus mirabilis TaxID=584 RepID=UPI000D7DD765|nr:sulfate adenylyltransferase subunit CysN [Proteus mirabilis]AWS56644.1 sulfate adenylyltransferase subunit CysN [Proteus mirabilis]ELB1206027.1 sulfate adenylyltransferase subunit CysN [Proteus mirabilis]ELB1225714.1 sulfate adenylyltransferase subunit CysN [Proteus mirabilis]EMB4671885.1 sulfate adenylyltransferase subunit CysN [Proteus mirabilis]MBG2955464.1 sulfate adenylyltransferase subunit CysN [Proteus mirabilis]